MRKHEEKGCDVDMANMEQPDIGKKVRYHKHATLTKRTNLASRETVWEFMSDDFERAYHDVRLTEILDDLSEEGYMLVCSTGDELILRTKEEFEEFVPD